MSNQFLPFALPDIGVDEIEEVVSCMKSGWLTTGPKTKQFEAEFLDYIGSKGKSIAVSSATAGVSSDGLNTTVLPAKSAGTM